MPRDPERERAIREEFTAGKRRSFEPVDVEGLLEEIDYLRKQLDDETAYASELRRLTMRDVPAPMGR